MCICPHIYTFALRTYVYLYVYWYIYIYIPCPVPCRIACPRGIASRAPWGTRLGVPWLVADGWQLCTIALWIMWSNGIMWCLIKRAQMGSCDLIWIGMLVVCGSPFKVRYTCSKLASEWWNPTICSSNTCLYIASIYAHICLQCALQCNSIYIYIGHTYIYINLMYWIWYDLIFKIQICIYNVYLYTMGIYI